MNFSSEGEFEAYVRQIIKAHVTAADPQVYALKNKKAVDILICRDAPIPELFFIEVKFHQAKHGRLGFGSKGGGGFQPEIVAEQPVYFEEHLRWVVGSEEHPGKVLFISSEVVRQYLSGGAVGEKFNNIQKKLFREGTWLSEEEFVQSLRGWLKVEAPNKSLNPTPETLAPPSRRGSGAG